MALSQPRSLICNKGTVGRSPKLGLWPMNINPVFSFQTVHLPGAQREGGRGSYQASAGSYTIQFLYQLQPPSPCCVLRELEIKRQTFCHFLKKVKGFNGLQPFSVPRRPQCRGLLFPRRPLGGGKLSTSTQ